MYFDKMPKGLTINACDKHFIAILEKREMGMRGVEK
jgi:hypothetical protein